MNSLVVPRCPNHRCPLVGCHSGIGECPVSGALFSYEAEEGEKTRKLRLNALGQYEEVSNWIVKNVDGKDS